MNTLKQIPWTWQVSKKNDPTRQASFGPKLDQLKDFDKKDGRQPSERPALAAISGRSATQGGCPSRIPSYNSPMSSTNKRVLVGMSGGVDSSVTAHLLKQQGYDVVGVTMKVWPQDCISRAEDKCCGPSAIADARGVAHKLGVPHYVVDEADQFERLVINYFSSEYRAGRTPNPCVMCNELLKFGNLWSKAAALGADYIATGHYAIIEHHDQGVVLRKGRDARKDQSYFLFSLSQKQLSRAMTPLGTMTKPEIREIARQLGLRVADKVDSQEICFVPGNDYKEFLRSHLGEGEFHRGGIYNVDGIVSRRTRWN